MAPADVKSGTLTVQQLGARRAGRWVFRRCSFRLSSGQALAVTGANGSGKSSLLRAVAGLLPTADGTLEWRDASGAAAVPRERLAYLGHVDGLQPDFSLRENLALARRMAGLPIDAPTRALMAHSLAPAALLSCADLPTRRLSQGQRRRAALLRVFWLERPLWLLDEPDAALDAQGDAWFDALLADHLSRGGSALIATHRPLRLCCLQLGELRLAGTSAAPGSVPGPEAAFTPATGSPERVPA